MSFKQGEVHHEDNLALLSSLFQRAGHLFLLWRSFWKDCHSFLSWDFYTKPKKGAMTQQKQESGRWVSHRFLALMCSLQVGNQFDFQSINPDTFSCSVCAFFFKRQTFHEYLSLLISHIWTQKSECNVPALTHWLSLSFIPKKMERKEMKWCRKENLSNGLQQSGNKFERWK